MRRYNKTHRYNRLLFITSIVTIFLWQSSIFANPDMLSFPTIKNIEIAISQKTYSLNPELQKIPKINPQNTIQDNNYTSQTLASDGTNTYTYDYENRLISATGTTSSTYQYDGFNRRISKTVDGVTTYYIYDGDNLIAEYNSSWEPVRYYTYSDNIDEPITLTNSGGTYYYHADGLGSITHISDSSGTLVEQYTYDVYGEPTIYDSTGAEIAESSISNHFMFTAREYDAAAGLYYYRNRHYDPTIGRFLQTDPLGYWDSMNLYAYVNNNPLNWIDPFGLGMWYDDLAEWAQGTSEKAKCNTTSGGTGAGAVAGQTALWTLIDFSMGIFQFPAALGHLGEGTGTWAGDPSLENFAGVAMDISVTASIGAITTGIIESLRTPYWRYTGPESNPSSGWVTRGKNPPYSISTAENKLSAPIKWNKVERVNIPQYEYVGGPRPAAPKFGKPGGGAEYKRGGFGDWKQYIKDWIGR